MYQKVQNSFFGEDRPMAAGRPRNFDVEQALDNALRVFWQKGYEGASLPELTAAMGINRPSLYAAFGNKEELFRKALDRYEAGPTAFVAKALGEPTARKVAERMLYGGIEMVTNKDNPGGCLVVHGALVCGDTAQPIREELERRRRTGELMLRKRFQQAKTAGDLPESVDAKDLANYITTVMRGMAVQAAGGATRKELLRVAELAMQAWPA
jgi:AcrR family transcriptional regulator